MCVILIFRCLCQEDHLCASVCCVWEEIGVIVISLSLRERPGRSKDYSPEQRGCMLQSVCSCVVLVRLL